MKLSRLLALPSILALATYATPEDINYATQEGDYREHLHLKPLPGGALYAGFSFTARTPLSTYEHQHFRFFPRSLGQILQYTHTAELHLRFSLGRWDEQSWGSRPRSGLREGGNGVELWAWLEGSPERQAEERWSDLVNSLSGLFCASLNFVDSTRTLRPLLTFVPEGDLDLLQTAQKNTTGQEASPLHLLHGMLPHEVVCTENLTPFLKLLPCKGKAGISSLLDGHKLFDANWQAMSVDVRPVCEADKPCELEIEQSVDMVLDIERSMRPRDNPIPRPPPREELVCDESKSYHGHDTCYPKFYDGELAWSLSSIFGRAIRGSCPLAGPNAHEVTLETPSGRTVQILSDAAVSPVFDASPDNPTTHYSLPESTPFDLSLPAQTLQNQPQTQTETDHAFPPPPLYASRQMTGYGQERGGMHTTFTNPHPWAQRVVLLESLPWFLRPYMHTLHLTGGAIEKMFYTPLLDRQRGTHLELLIAIPPHTTVELTYEFEKTILRYTEYPPDANRGFDVPAAVIRVLPPIHQDFANQSSPDAYYLRTTSLLLPLPTPDFSMPYNVIILTSTVIALGFGSIFNLLIRTFVLVHEVPPMPALVAAKSLLARVRAAVERFRGGGREDAAVKNGVQGEDAVVETVVEDVVDAKVKANVNGIGRPKSERKKDR